MKTPGHYRQNFGLTNLKDFNLGQSLFALYNSNGKLIREFGEFPPVFGTEKLMYTSAQSYYYSVSNNSIYICFPVTNTIIEYDFKGVKINSYQINLPGFNYPETNHEGWVDTINGFASYEDSENGLGFYFFTYQKDDGEIKTMLHRFNKNNNSVKSGIITDTIYPGMILPNANYAEVKYITMRWDEEPVEIIEFKIN
jgi:hypothetical protein